MDAAEIVGYRFHPTDKDLVSYHLKRRLMGMEEKKCLIPVLNIYDYEPWELPKIYDEKSDKKSCGKKCFFFCPRNSSGSRKSRKAGGGYWKDTTQKRIIKAGKTVGKKGIFTFYEGKQKKGTLKTEWVMHEYLLEALNEGTVDDLKAFALCYFKTKPMPTKKKAPASACEAKSSSPSTAIVEVNEPNQDIVTNMAGNESPDWTSGMINVDELLQDIGGEETSPDISHESAPSDVAASSGQQGIEDSCLVWCEFAENGDVSFPDNSGFWTEDELTTLL